MSGQFALREGAALITGAAAAGIDLLISGFYKGRFGAPLDANFRESIVGGQASPIMPGTFSMAMWNAILTFGSHASAETVKNLIENVSPRGLIPYEELLGIGLLPPLIHWGGIILTNKMVIGGEAGAVSTLNPVRDPVIAIGTNALGMLTGAALWDTARRLA